MAKPPDPSKEYSTSDQSMWKPQGDALQQLYDQSSSWLSNNDGKIDSLSQQAMYRGNDAYDSADRAWENQLTGGNLSGYDIAGGLQGMLQQDNNISSNNVNSQNINGTNVNSQNVNSQNVNGQNINQNQIGQLNSPTLQMQMANRFSGGNSSLDNMRGTIQNSAKSAQDNMMQGLDARAAASGMSGGSRHGTATAKGMQDINSNMQTDLANIGYDAYNKDYDRSMQMGAAADQFNEARNVSDQSNAFNTQMANQSNDMQGQMANQQSNLQGQMANQQSNMQGQLANQNNNMQAQSANQQANLQGQMANQQSDMQAKMANQNFTQEQQKLVSDLLGQQNTNSSNAIGQQANMQGYIDGPMQGLMNSTAGMQFMQQMLGSPTTLTQQESSSNGASGGSGVSGNIGTSGANLSF